MAEYPYAGKIKNQGQQRVEAPYKTKGEKGVTVKHTGSDLRSGKKG